MLKLILICIFAFLIRIPVFSQNKNSDFEKTVRIILKAYQKKDTTTINKYIHSGTGLFLLYRPGVLDNYKKFDRILFEDSLEYPKFHTIEYPLLFTRLRTNKMPEFDCDNGKWNAVGTFSTYKIYHDLSNVIKLLNEYIYEDMEEKISVKFIRQIKQIEDKSRKVISCKNIKGWGSELIFHLVYIRNKWYLWLIDQVTTDCGA